MKPAILVTGATGNVGQYVVKSLMERGQNVVTAGSRTDELKRRFPTVKHVEFDFENPGTYEAALDGVDRVFLMRPPQIGKAEVFQPFVDTMAKRPLRLVTFLSLMGVEHNPFLPHHKIEKMIEAAGMPYVHIRPGFFMQNVTGVHVEEIRKDDTIFIPAGHSKVSFIDAEDIGKAVACVLCEPGVHRGKAYTLTGPEALDYIDIANQLTLLLGRHITYANPSMLAYRAHYINVRGLEPAYVNVTMALYLMTRLGTARQITDDFERLTGETPRTFAAFAREHLTTFQE